MSGPSQCTCYNCTNCISRMFTIDDSEMKDKKTIGCMSDCIWSFGYQTDAMKGRKKFIKELPVYYELHSDIKVNYSFVL